MTLSSNGSLLSKEVSDMIQFSVQKDHSVAMWRKGGERVEAGEQLGNYYFK